MSDSTFQFQVAIPGGPSFTIGPVAIAVKAYDVASATIAAGASNVDVVVQPSSTKGDVVFVVVTSDQYDAGLTYKVDGAADVHALDAPHLLLGAGAVGFMNGGAPPKTLTFSSSLKNDANIQVVAGRNSL
jgi:hypothetical protein